MNMGYVILGDPTVSKEVMDAWARDICPSFVRSEDTDVSDISGMYDTLRTYWFDDEADLAWFKLRWQ